MTRNPRRTGRALVAVAAAVLALVPQAAAAHASVISSQPSPNATYATSPGAVVLVFSEPLNTALSRASVTTPSVRRAEATVVQQRQMQVRVPDTAPGIYRVEWTAVSAADGHVLSGSFEFGVRVKVGAGRSAGALALASSDWLLAALRWIEYLGLLLAIGTLVLGSLGRRSTALPWAARSPLVPLALTLAAGLAVVAVEIVNAAPELNLAAAGAFLSAGIAGPARLAGVLAEALAVAVAARWPRLAAVPLAVVAGALAGSGHATTLPAWPAPAALYALHMASAGAWAGGILSLATLRPPGGWRSQAARALLDRFTPVALAAFVVTLLTGTVQALLTVAQPERLLSTAYRNTLLVKTLMVAAMLPLSFLAWKGARARPRLEAGIAVAVVGASSLLTSYPITPARFGLDQAAQQEASSPALPRDGSLSLASHAGDTLIALSLRPGRPGPNSIYLELLPIVGPSAVRGLAPSLTIDGHPLTLRRCGASCRMSRADLRGGELLEVRLPGVSEVASFPLPALPAADASDLVSRLEQRMAGLRSYRIEEVLGPAAVPLHTTYWFQAPDRLRYDLGTGGQTVIIGSTRYERDSPVAGWKQEPTVAVNVPSYPWESARPTGAYALGSDPSRGAGVMVVAFFEDANDQQPVCYRLWVRVLERHVKVVRWRQAAASEAAARASAGRGISGAQRPCLRRRRAAAKKHQEIMEILEAFDFDQELPGSGRADRGRPQDRRPLCPAA